MAVILFIGCKKSKEDKLPEKSFYEQAAGKWVPYQKVAQDGTVTNSSFTALTIFGAYDECVQLNKDSTFIPINWTGSIFNLQPNEGGKYEYLPGNKLHFKSAINATYDIILFESNELWLIIRDEAYKFRRY
jgi:hypothetical protein